MSLLPNVIGIHHQIRIIYSMGNAGGDVKKLLNQAQLQNVILERKINENVVEKTHLQDLFVSKNIACAYELFHQKE